jgi:ATP-dependent Clp endopeptidase proteolytic subunit ClpP
MDKKPFRTTRLIANLRQGRNDWYRITNTAGPQTAQLHIYDEIGYFGVTAADMIRDLSQVQGDLEVHLNTPGGEVFDGIAIHNALSQRDGQVRVIVDSLAASIGSVIAMAASPGELVMAKNATMMIHDGFGVCIGNESDMNEMAALLSKTSDNIASIYAERTGQPASQWREAMRAESWYSAQEAVDARLADSVQGGKGGTRNTWDLSVFGGPRPDIRNEKYNADDRKRMAANGHAMPDGSYPIEDSEDLGNAIHAVGRGGADHDAIRRHIIKRANALGLASRIPDNWNGDGSINSAPDNHYHPLGPEDHAALLEVLR